MQSEECLTLPWTPRTLKIGGIQYLGYMCRTVPESSTNTFLSVGLLMDLHVSLCEFEQIGTWVGDGRRGQAVGILW